MRYEINKKLKQEIQDILNFQLKDNTKARIVDDKLNNVKIQGNEPLVRSQQAIYKYLKDIMPILNLLSFHLMAKPF